MWSTVKLIDRIGKKRREKKLDYYEHMKKKKYVSIDYEYQAKKH